MTSVYPQSDPTLSDPAALASDGSPDPNGSGSDYISRADHEAAIKAERQRQAGIERERRRLQRQLEEAQGQGSQQLQPRQEPQRESQRQSPITPEMRARRQQMLDRLPPNDPAREILADVYSVQDQWTGWAYDSAAEARQREQMAALSGAIQTAVRAGVPLEEIEDEPTPQAVSAKAREWLREKQIADMAAEIKALREGNASPAQPAQPSQPAAPRRPPVPAVTGQPVQNGTGSVDDQIRAVQAELTHLSEVDTQGRPIAGGSNEERMVTRRNISLALAYLQEWKASGQSAPAPRMPMGWQPGSELPRAGVATRR